ncbi:nucleoside-diphosphate kinase [Paenibacillus ginsengarvi]|uniref:Nucleoside diphosphate kinase n=1 Tax=Paenibacillus ginsengarvi TaxID=400777 RepID=A0A3B0CIP8_9BACL|nr:nucleoside-diphosphate kinase [Paenibacillus ginsengarvi]RKN84578.1 nucleoside-diphosphate kinase [Paenibacillus ginsengarvi]
MERTFLMVKPDGVQRGLIGEIVHRFERKGFTLVAAKLMMVPKEKAEAHYAEHHGRPYYDDLMSFITSGPVFAMVWEGDQVIALSRIMMGKTNTLEAQPGTIRGDYAVHTNRNLIHGSDSPENAVREMAIFFEPHELVSYNKTIQTWI